MYLLAVNANRGPPSAADGIYQQLGYRNGVSVMLGNVLKNLVMILILGRKTGWFGKF